LTFKVMMHAAMCAQVLASSPRGAASDSAASSSLHLPDDLPGQSNCGGNTTASSGEQGEEHFSLFAATSSSSSAHGAMQQHQMGYGSGPSSAAVPIPAPRSGRMPELVRPQQVRACACTVEVVMHGVGLQPPAVLQWPLLGGWSFTLVQAQPWLPDMPIAHLLGLLCWWIFGSSLQIHW
jgi:hypothetical protein